METVMSNGIEIPVALVWCAPIVMVVLQAFRNIAVFDKLKGALPFVAMACGVAIAFLGMPDGATVKEIVLAGLLLGCSASGLHGVAQAAGIDKVIKFNSATMVVLLLFTLIAGSLGGCVGVSSEYEQLIVQSKVVADNWCDKALAKEPAAEVAVEAAAEGEAADCYVGELTCEQVKLILCQNAERWGLFLDAVRGVAPEGGDEK